MQENSQLLVYVCLFDYMEIALIWLSICRFVEAGCWSMLTNFIVAQIRMKI